MLKAARSPKVRAVAHRAAVQLVVVEQPAAVPQAVVHRAAAHKAVVPQVAVPRAVAVRLAVCRMPGVAPLAGVRAVTRLPAVPAAAPQAQDLLAAVVAVG